MQKKHLSLLFLAVVFVMFSACPGEPEEEGDPVPTSITIDSPPDKTVYTVGEELDITGLVVTAHYENHPDGEVHLISKYTGFDSSTPGVKTVTVTFRGETATFTVTVNVGITDITGVPSSAIAGTPLELIGTVTPAGDYVITWTVKSGPATISNGNSLTATATGTVVVTATVGSFTKEFTITVYPAGTVIVTSNADTGAGSLRQAITSVTAGNKIVIDPSVKTITLTGSSLSITKAVTIEGNGLTITPAAGRTVNSISQMMSIGDGGTVTVSRVWFKDGRANVGGALTVASGGSLTLESCIFSGNQSATYYGGAVDNSGTLTIKGCTFSGNSSTTSGGAVYNIGTLTFAGNVFYGNTCGTSSFGPAVYTSPSGSSPVTTSSGYNVVDVALGTGATQSGWVSVTGDAYRAESPFGNAETFEPVVALRSIVPQPFATSMPATDFNGETRTYPGAPGAVK